MALLQARRQQKRRSLPSRANAAAEDGSEVEDAGGAVKENIPPAARCVSPYKSHSPVACLHELVQFVEVEEKCGAGMCPSNSEG